MELNTEDVELYDSDRAALQGLVRWLNQRLSSGGPQRIEAVADEIMERLYKLGFESEVRFSTDDNYTGPEEERIWYPSVYLTARVDPEAEYDHERQGHEVRSDILGLNPQGDVQKKAVGQTGFTQTGSGLFVPGQN